MSKEFNAIKETENAVSELLKLLDIDAKVNVSEAEENGETTLTVHIDADKETGLLIGTHGSTLNAIQVFLGMALRQKSGDWRRIVVNIGDWKEKQEEQLVTLAESTAARAKSSGEPQRLYNLTPSQRRVIHMALSKDETIETESSGEGVERHLIVRLKA